METTVIDRIKIISNEKEVSHRQFAIKIEFNYTTLNHFITGRNKTPSIELVSKILTVYPDVSADWLLLGQGAMYKNGAIPAVAIDNDGILMKTIIDLSGQVALLKERVRQLEGAEQTSYKMVASPVSKYGE